MEIWSRFNLLFENNGSHYLYNTLNGGLCEIDESLFSVLKDIENKDKDIYFLDPEIIDYLKSNKYIVDENHDNDEICKLRYLKLRQSFQNERLSLVIAPTLFCNFACPYCYEKNLPNTQMSNQTIESLIRFIKTRERNYKYLEICWHGGEPLTAIPVIRKILKRINEDCALPIRSHVIVTNGYLINEHFFDCFSKYPLSYVQITIDGNRVTHNSNRISKDGNDTFDIIINNVDTLTRRVPSVSVGIRMNVHKSNAQDFLPLYKELSKRWEGRNVNIYPAFVMDNSGCRVACFNSTEKTSFMYDIYKCIGKKHSLCDAKIKTGKCTAIFENSYVIDPLGNIYKCWVDVGVPDMRIGTLEDGFTNYGIIEKYLLSSDKFSDEKCLACKLFPICTGGCNKYRIDKSYNTTDICPISEDLLPRFLV